MEELRAAFTRCQQRGRGYSLRHLTRERSTWPRGELIGDIRQRIVHIHASVSFRSTIPTAGIEILGHPNGRSKETCVSDSQIM
jgi:hypothetical protein